MDYPVRERLAYNVRWLRLTRNWTQAELAQRAEVCQTNISSLEREKGKSPRLETISCVAKAFGIPTWMLLMNLDEFQPSRA